MMTALWIEDTVDLVGHHRILHQVTYYDSWAKGHVWECRCGEKSGTLPDQATARREARRHTDTAILAALAGAGLLLQPGGESRVEIEVQTRGLRYPVSDMERAWLQYGELRSKGWEAEILTRTVHLGAWLPVEGGAS